jgi:hypothetical protein
VVGQLVTATQSVQLRPLLLNPGDTLTLAIITSGGAPRFIPKARIAGVTKVLLNDVSKGKAGWKRASIYFAVALLAFVLYFMYGAAIIRPSAVFVTRPLAILSMLSCGIASSFALGKGYQALGIELNVYTASWALLPGVIIGVVVYVHLLQKSRRAAAQRRTGPGGQA